MDFARTANVLADQRVLDQPLQADRDGLVHLAAYHAPDDAALFAVFATHACFSLLFWLSTVLSRAISLRTCLSSCGEPSWPVPCCIRRENCCLRSSSSRLLSSLPLFCCISLAFITATSLQRWSGHSAWLQRGGKPRVRCPR